MKVLECSTKGDKRFSALTAKVMVKVNGEEKFDSIEVHYQNAKEYLDEFGNFVKPKDWKEAKHWQHKRRKPVRLNINGIILPLDFLSQYYKTLWVKYLDANPSLVEYAKQFDDFTDVFRTETTMNCQADVIKQYVKEGRGTLLHDCQPLIKALRGVFVQEVIGDLLKAKELVIGHQVNCMGIMGGGLAKLIKEKYGQAFKEYSLICKAGQKSRSLMGHCQLVEIKEDVVMEGDELFVYPENEGKLVKIVANLFGQHEIGTDQKRTEEIHLQKALEVMKATAMERGYSCALPYELGSRLGGGDWNEILGIIQKVFSDYPVTIYRLPNA